MTYSKKMLNHNVLLSTDIGSDPDDAVSLLAMLNHPKINLGGIYTVNGDVDARSYIAKHMVNLAGKKIPVGRGAAEPLGAVVLPYSHGEKYFVDHSFIDDKLMEERDSRDLIFKPLQEKGIVAEGVKHLASVLSQERYIIFSIAPMTNLAILQRDYPCSFSNIEHLYVMGSKFPPEQELEHNFRFDARAAQEVLSSDLPITLIPGNLCSRYTMPTSLLEQAKSKAGKYVNRMVRAYSGGETARDLERIFEGRSVKYLLEEIVKIPEGSPQSYFIEKRKQQLLQNLDVEAAFCEPDLFWQDYCQLIEHISNPVHKFKFGGLLAKELERGILKTISIADVYVPYCFLHPERLVVERLTVTSDDEGRTLLLPGDKQEVVRDLDWDHFNEFLQMYLK